MTYHGITFDRDEIGEFCRRHRIKRLSLFGSILREDFRPDSDIDILVEFEPGPTPTLFDLGGKYFRLLLVGYFEGIDSERGIAWRCADSLSVRSFVGYGIEQTSTDHSTISRTRRLIDLETHQQVFQWVLKVLADYDLVSGKTVGVDATTLEANAAMRSIVRKDTKQNYQEFLTGLAKASGIDTPTREDLVKIDKKRKNKASNDDWENPHDPDVKIAKMKDGK